MELIEKLTMCMLWIARYCATGSGLADVYFMKLEVLSLSNPPNRLPTDSPHAQGYIFATYKDLALSNIFCAFSPFISPHAERTVNESGTF